MDLILNGSTYVQLALGLLILWISFILIRREKHLKLNEPLLVPYKYPIIGHTFDYFKDTEAFLNQCQEERGEIFSLYVFGQIITIVGKELSPEIFRNYKDFNFFDAQSDMFPIGPFLRRPRPFFNTTSEILQKALPGGSKFYMERFQRQLPKIIDEIIGDGKVLQPPLKTLRVVVAKLATTSIIEDLSDDELTDSFARATDDLAPYLSKPPILGFIHPTLHKYFLIILFQVINPFKARRELIKQKIIPVVDKRLHEMEKQGDTYVPPVDILQRIIEVFHYDYDAITDVICFTIFASIHTTTTFLTYSLQEYANRPQFHEELLKEQEELLKDNDGNLLIKLAKMEKLDSLVKETLRVNPSLVGISHKVISSHFNFSNGYQVPKDRVVYNYLQEIHSNEKTYGLNANEFDAFRHLKNSATHPERSFLTFGLGRYACPGRTLAVNGIKFILHYLLLRYNIKNVGDEITKPKVIGPYRIPNDAGMIFEKKKLNDA